MLSRPRDGLNVAIVAIVTEIVCKYCYRYTVTDMSQRLHDGQLAEAFYCPTYFFPNLFLTFYDFLFATLSEKGPEMRHLQLL